MKSIYLCLSLVLALTASGWSVHFVRDDLGHAVAVPEHAHRLVCLTPSVTNTVYAIGAAADVVGITDYSFYPPEARRQKPSVGEVVRPSVEKIASLHPDLVIAQSVFNDPEILHELQRIGIPVFVVEASNLAGVYKAIASIGRVLSREREATALIEQLRARENKVRAMSQNKYKPSLFLVISMDPCITAGRDAFVTELIGAAGGRSVTADLPRDWLQINIEAVIPKRPDYILVVNGSPFGLKDMQQRAGWSSLEAVRQGRVIQVDDRIQYPSPVAFDALEELARRISALQAQ